MYRHDVGKWVYPHMKRDVECKITKNDIKNAPSPKERRLIGSGLLWSAPGSVLFLSLVEVEFGARHAVAGGAIPLSHLSDYIAHNAKK